MGDVIDTQAYLIERTRKKLHDYCAHRMPLAEGVEYVTIPGLGSAFFRDGLRDTFPVPCSPGLECLNVMYCERPAVVDNQPFL